MSHEPTTNDPQNPDRLTTALQAALREPTPGDPAPSAEMRATLAARLNMISSSSTSSIEVTPMSTSPSQSSWGRVAATLVASVVAAGVAIAIFLPANQSSRESVRRAHPEQSAATKSGDTNDMTRNPRPPAGWTAYPPTETGREKRSEEFTVTGSKTSETSAALINGYSQAAGGRAYNVPAGPPLSGAPHLLKFGHQPEQPMPALPGIGFNPARDQLGEQQQPAIDRQSLRPGDVVDSRSIRPDVTRLSRSELFKNDPLKPSNSQANTPTPSYAVAKPDYGQNIAGQKAEIAKLPDPRPNLQALVTPRTIIQEEEADRLLGTTQSGKSQDHPADPSGEQYEQRVENIFQGVRAEPLSTFSIDVDTASYANCRRYLNDRQLPPTAAVRVEEFINYFRYDYPQPTGKDPFSVNMEMADCPWTPNHKLLRIGLKGKEIDRRERPESNLVFLVDVSGSMSSEDKLPLLRDAMHRWVNELSANDRVTIVTYAGDAGLRLPTTRGDQKDKLHAAIETLQSGGSTHGSTGIKLAYEQATENFLEDGGVNRVLWATDGDLNVGTTGDDELVELITKKAKTGVFLTVLGVGTGNLKDAKLEKMADKGNGVYAYLDSPKEARKVLIEQMSGTTITIAKDVKIQIEFNPAEIAGYRLIGYENRMLAAQDFANDKKDAGEIGAGHTVTALYEIIPVGADIEPGKASTKEPLKYQAAEVASGSTAAEVTLSDAAKTGELLTLKLRFKQPDAHESVLREFPLKERGGKFTAASKDFQFAGCVAQLAMILRDSQYRGEMTTAAIAEIAAATRGEDKDCSRAEFVELVKRVKELGK